MNPLLKAREVTHHLADSGATVIFTGAASTAEVLAGAATVDAQVVVVDSTFTEMLSTAIDAMRWWTGTARTRR